MSENAKLTVEQSNVVRNLYKAVEAFGKESAFQPEALRKRVHEIIMQFGELKKLFPEAAKEAKEYYEADLPEEPEEKDSYGDALFSVLLDLHSFYDAESFNYVVRAHESLSNSIFDLSTFSEEFDSMRSGWVDEVDWDLKEIYQ